MYRVDNQTSAKTRKMSRHKEYGPKNYMAEYIVPSEKEWDKYKSWILAWLDKKVVIGDRWFFVELAWVKRYMEWLKSDQKKPEPGPVEVNTETRQDLLTKEDLMSHKPLVYIIWEHISQRFTVRDDQLPIMRNTVYGPNKEAVVEETLERIYLVHHSNLNELIPYGTSRLDRFFENHVLQQAQVEDTLERVGFLPLVLTFLSIDKNHAASSDEVETHLRTCFDIPHTKLVRISHLWSWEEDVWEVLRYKSDRLDTLRCQEEPHQPRPRDPKHLLVFLVETQDPQTWEWPMTARWRRLKGEACFPTAKHIATEFYAVGSYGTSKAVTGGHTAEHMYRGLCGLYNFETNCYMSAIIQPLAALPSVRDYFLTDTHLTELNPSNPLGRGGKFAQVFGDLVKHIWSGHYLFIKPFYFKKAMGIHKEDYNRYEMNDAHEFLLYLLDGLHEDCNRIISKPYISLSNVSGRPDAELAADAWLTFKKRNDSVIVDTFYGLTRTSVRCPECGHTSTSFEPTPCISLSIPTHRVIAQVSFRPRDSSKPFLQLKLKLHEGLSLSEVRARISLQSGVPENRIAMGHMNLKNVWTEWRDNSDDLRKMVTTRISQAYVALEVPECDSESVKLLVTLAQPALASNRAWNAWLLDSVSLYDIPFYVSVPIAATYDLVYEAVMRSLVEMRLIEEPEKGQHWWGKDKKEEDNYIKQVEKFIKDRERTFDIPDMDNKCHNWERNGKHYIFRLYQEETHQVHLPNNDEPLKLTKEGGRFMVEFHPLYCRHYLDKLISSSPKVKVLPSWRLQANMRPVFELTDCLDNFHRTESFCFTNTWTCGGCNKQTIGVTSEGIWSLPLYLIIHLKRFQYTALGGDENKLASMVKFPERGLDLSPYVVSQQEEEGAALYDLMAVTNHHGPKSSSGHYTAYVRHAEDGCWYYHDDDIVCFAQPEEVQTRAAYLLFYKRRCRQDLTFPTPKDRVSQPDIPAPPEQPKRPSMNPSLHKPEVVKMFTPHSPATTLDIDAPYKIWRDSDMDYDHLR